MRQGLLRTLWQPCEDAAAAEAGHQALAADNADAREGGLDFFERRKARSQVLELAEVAKTDDPMDYRRRAVQAWLAARVPALREPLSWTRLEGGHNNLTYLLEDADGQRAVIRRPPMGCWPTRRAGVQVAAILRRPAITGAHFYLMGPIDGPMDSPEDGRAPYTTDDTRRWATLALRQTLQHSFIDGLADLHATTSTA